MRIRHLRDKLILASLIVVVPFATWSILTQVARARENHSTAIRLRWLAAMHVADRCANHVRDVAALDRSIGMALWDKHSMSPSEASQYLTRVTRNVHFLLHSAAVDPKGKIIASDMPGMVGINASNHPHIREVMNGHSWTLSNVFVPEVIGKPVIAINAGIRDSRGNMRGMVVSFIEPASIQGVLNLDVTLGMRPDEEIVITDSKGTVFLAHGKMNFKPLSRQWSRMPFITGALRGKPSVIDGFETPDEQVIMGMSVPVDRLGWTVSAFTSREEVLGPVRRHTILTALIGLFFVGITIGLAVYVGNTLSRPIIRLSNTARSFGSGNLSARASVHTGDELEILCTSFNEMASAQQSQTEQLNAALEKECRERHKASALYLIAQGIVVNVTLKDRLEVIAQALASICGVKRCAIFLRRGDRLVGTTGWGLIETKEFSEMTVDIGAESAIAQDALIPGTPILIPNVDMDPRTPQALLQECHLKGFLALPLVRRQHLVGLAVLDNPGEYLHFDNETISTARGLAVLAAIAIENAESYEKWTKISEAFQGAMLPSIPAKIGSFDLACRYYSAVEIAELGGDFYDLIEFDDGRIALVIADVSGKGLEAAIFTAMGKYTIRAFSSENPEPASVLKRTNEAIQGAAGEMGFLTLFYGLLDPQTGKLVYASAGHPPPLVTRESGDLSWLSGTERQPPLGILGMIDYKQWEFQLEVGDVLTCYTDGVIESRQNGEMFDMERLAGLLGDIRDHESGEIAVAIHEAVVEFSHGKIQDDIALLVVKYANV